MTWVKNPNWTWKTEVCYYLYFMPKELFKALLGLMRKDHVLNDMNWREYLECSLGIADMKAGRWYRRVVEEKE